jgi:hypothetical protein
MQLPEGFKIEFEELREGLQMAPEVSIRYNTDKGMAPVEGAGLVAWCSAGCYYMRIYQP